MFLSSDEIAKNGNLSALACMPLSMHHLIEMLPSWASDEITSGADLAI